MPRLCDVNGDIIEIPPGYEEAKKGLEQLIDNMENMEIDRSDMAKIFWAVVQEGNFHLFMLGKRGT